jgi:hypothetical protein
MSDEHLIVSVRFDLGPKTRWIEDDELDRDFDGSWLEFIRFMADEEGPSIITIDWDRMAIEDARIGSMKKEQSK